MYIDRPEVEVVVKSHAPDCIANRNLSRLGQCRCPKYLYIRRDRARISAKTRSWETARDKAVEYANAHDPQLIEKRQADEEKQNTQVLLSAAVEKFKAARKLISVSEKTNKNLEPDCNQFLHFINQWNSGKPELAKVQYVSQVTTSLLNEWMATWKGRAKRDSKGQPTTDCTVYTKQKKRKHINMFFKYSVGEGWIKENPAARMLMVSRRNQPSAIPKLPFERDQMEAILKAAEQEVHSPRARVFISTMRRSGLSIIDATTLERDRLRNDDRLLLYRTKTGEEVCVPLEPELAQQLRVLPALDDPGYFFWTGRGEASTAANNWGKVLRRIFRRAQIKMKDRYGNPLQPSSHFFRNTFVKELVETGEVSLDQIATLLGDSPQVVHEHYSKFVPSLRRQLERAVRASWSADKRSGVCRTCGHPLAQSGKHKDDGR
jgi:integrase